MRAQQGPASSIALDKPIPCTLFCHSKLVHSPSAMLTMHCAAGETSAYSEHSTRRLSEHCQDHFKLTQAGTHVLSVRDVSAISGLLLLPQCYQSQYKA